MYNKCHIYTKSTINKKHSDRYAHTRDGPGVPGLPSGPCGDNSNNKSNQGMSDISATKSALIIIIRPIVTDYYLIID